MPFNFKNANVGVRENRLGSITGFSGDLIFWRLGNARTPLPVRFRQESRTLL